MKRSEQTFRDDVAKIKDEKTLLVFFLLKIIESINDYSSAVNVIHISRIH